MATVIVGAGIIGITTAYYLSEHQPADTIHLVESAPALLASASGFAGGFLARDGFGPEVAALAALSFDQHRRLADQHDGRAHWGYAPSTSLDYRLPVAADGGNDRAGHGGPDLMGHGSSAGRDVHYAGGLPAWVRPREGASVQRRAADGTSAQIDPLSFSQHFLDVLRARGVHIHQPARVVAVDTDADGVLAGVRLAGTVVAVLPCTRLILAAGAWTGRVLDELFATGGLPISSVAGHSLLLRVPGATAADAVYGVFATGGSLGFHAVLFGRADGSVYVAGLNSTAIPVPAEATDSTPHADQLDQLLAAAKEVLNTDAGSAGSDAVAVLRAGLCHRPVTPWGFPLVLRLPDSRLGAVRTQPGAAGGVFVAAGHGPWGISMGPGTGMLLAELVQGRPLSADISGLGMQALAAA